MRIAQMNSPSVQTVDSAKKGKTEQMEDAIPFSEILNKSNEMRSQAELDSTDRAEDVVETEVIQQEASEVNETEDTEQIKLESDTKDNEPEMKMIIDGQALSLMQDTGFVIKNELTPISTKVSSAEAVAVETVNQTDVATVQSEPQQTAAPVDILQEIGLERVSPNESTEFIATINKQTVSDNPTALADNVQQAKPQQTNVSDIPQAENVQQSVEAKLSVITPQMEADIVKLEVNNQPIIQPQVSTTATEDTKVSVLPQGQTMVAEENLVQTPIADVQNRQTTAHINEQQAINTNESPVLETQTVSNSSNTQQDSDTNSGEKFGAVAQQATERNNRTSEVDSSNIASRIAFSSVYSGKENLITTNQIDAKQTVNQVTTHINEMIAQKTETMTIELAPESLGKITVELSLEQGKLTIDVKADTVATSNLLAEHIDEVKKSISVNSTTVVEVNVQNEVDINTSSRNPFSDFASANQGESDKSSGHDAHGANTVTTAIKQEADQGEIIKMIDNHLINYLV